MKKKIEVISEERDYDGYLKIDEGIINESDESGEKIQYSRFKITRPDAVAILVYNYEIRKLILTKQFRYPVYGKFDGNLIEIAAGKIDEGESPMEAAERELVEEIGYQVTKDTLNKAPFEIFVSPGYSNEKIYVFFALVTNKDRVSEGGGLESEHEDIEIVEMSIQEFKNKIISNEIMDAKTIVSSHYVGDY